MGFKLGNLTLPDSTDVMAKAAGLLRSDRYRPDYIYREERIGPLELDPGGSLRLFGPRQGFVWDLRRLTINGLQTPNGLRLYKGEPNPSGLLDIATGGLNQYHTGVIVVYPGNELWIENPNVVGLNIHINATLYEAPVNCEWTF